jgi:hypothetical protein
MLAKLRAHLTYANVMATIAVFIALGSGAYAAATIGAGDIEENAVRSKHVKDGKIKRADLNADALGEGCATGQRLIEGLCYDESPQAANTLGNAGNDCGNLGGQLPGAMQLRTIRTEPGIDLGTGTWSADLQFTGTTTPPNDLLGVFVTDAGGVALRDDQEDLPFRCVYQPLTPE